jgi:hypothetical protein
MNDGRLSDAAIEAGTMCQLQSDAKNYGFREPTREEIQPLCWKIRAMIRAQPERSYDEQVAAIVEMIRDETPVVKNMQAIRLMDDAIARLQ